MSSATAPPLLPQLPPLLLLLLLLPLLIRLVACSPVPDADGDDDDDNSGKPCCFPETWHGFVKILYGKVERGRRARAGMVTTEMSIDGRRKRTALKVNTGSPRTDFSALGFFNETSGKDFRFYVFATHNATKCWTYRWKSFEYHRACLPPNANFKGSFRVGPKDRGLAVDVWGLGETTPGFAFTSEVLVTRTGCLPVALREFGADGNLPEDDDYYEDDDRPTPAGRPPLRAKGKVKKFVVGSIYNDLELHIKDERVFDLPEACRSRPRRFPPKPEDLFDPEAAGEEGEGVSDMLAVLDHVMA